jgi:hypothetical protein
MFHDWPAEHLLVRRGNFGQWALETWGKAGWYVPTDILMSYWPVGRWLIRKVGRKTLSASAEWVPWASTSNSKQHTETRHSESKEKRERLRDRLGSNRTTPLSPQQPSTHHLLQNHPHRRRSSRPHHLWSTAQERYNDPSRRVRFARRHRLLADDQISFPPDTLS